MKTLRLLMVAIILVGCMLFVTREPVNVKAQSTAEFPALMLASSDSDSEVHFKVTVTAWVEGNHCKYVVEQECVTALHGIFGHGFRVAQELAGDAWYIICIENGIGP